MAWIEVHDNLREHHKTYALAAALKVERFAAVGLVVSLWTWAVIHAQDGDLSKYPDEAIASACMWKKKPETLLNALKATGFMTDNMMIHDWEEYAGKLIDRREANARRNREARARANTKKEKGDAPKASRDTPKDIQQEHHERITSASRDGATVPNLTIPNHTSIPPIVPQGTATRSQKAAMDAMFDDFWAAYPKKVAKATAKSAFLKHKPTLELVEKMIAGIEKYKKTDQWTRDGGQYIPHAATWLNQKRWEDEIPTGGKRVSFQAYDQTDQWQDTTYDRVGPDLLAEARAMTSKEDE